MSDKVLEVRGLVKSYGGHRAVDGIGFEVRRGEVFALLGPNGAGKTTTLEIMEGMREADEGLVEVAGFDVRTRRAEALARLGIQLQAQGLPPSMTPSEALAFFGAYRGRAARAGILERFGLEALRDKPCRQLSTGLQRRLALALALAHDPEILVLDEPTAGLDVESRNALHEAIREERARGRTVILASHDMAEVEKLADRAMMLVHGRIVAMGSPRQITACGDSATRLSLRTRDGSLGDKLESIARLEGVTARPEIDREGYMRMKIEGPGPVLAWMIGSIAESGDEILDLRLERPTLEERFLELAGGAA